MGWVRDGVGFSDRMKRFLLPKQDTLQDQVFKVIEQESPEALEAMIRSVIKEIRPTLANCVIAAMKLNYEHYRWEVLVIDQSLPPVEAGCMIECEQL